MTLLEAVAIALDEAQVICAEDGDETCYEITIGDAEMFSVRVFYEGGEAGATVTIPDLLIPRKDGLTPETEMRSIVRRVRTAARDAAPW